jgi:hypothetical protein
MAKGKERSMKEFMITPLIMILAILTRVMSWLDLSWVEWRSHTPDDVVLADHQLNQVNLSWGMILIFVNLVLSLKGLMLS